MAQRKPSPKSKRAAVKAARAGSKEPRIAQAFTNEQLEQLVALRNQGLQYNVIADTLEAEHGEQWSIEALRRAYNNYADRFLVSDSAPQVQALQLARRAQRAQALTRRQNAGLLDYLNTRDAIMDEIRRVVEDTTFTKVKLPSPPKAVAARTDMTMELMVSDVHFGKLTSQFNLEVCRERLRKLTTVFLQELDRKRAHYNVHRIVLALLGDLIENAVMHGVESAKGCEFGNAEQVFQCIDVMFHEVLVPIAATGIEIDAVGVGGNHDREGEKQTYSDPGKSALTWIVYNTLQLLCTKSGLTNVRWHIPTGAYVVLQIYRDHILYEHGDFMKGGDRKTFRKRLADRSAQHGIVLRGLRLGHWHEFSCYDNGVAIVNASVCGEDSYSDINAYGARPGQVINYYVRTANRDNDYYYSFLVQL